jgi:hypothetical protein
VNQEIKAQWVTALLSDDYVQGHNRLTTIEHDENGAEVLREDCCLGVLTDLGVKAGIVTTEVNKYGSVTYGSEGVRDFLPHEVVAWAELTEFSPRVPYGDGTQALATLNDGNSGSYDPPDTLIPRHTFAQIADLIEEHL